MGRVSPFLSSPAHLPVPQLWRLKATISADFSGLGGGWGAPRWFLWPLWGQVTGVLTGSQRRIGWKDQAWPGVGVRRGSGFRDVCTAWRVLKGTLPNTLPRQCWLPGPSWGWRKCAQEWRPPPPPPEPRDGGCPGDLSRTHVSASSHQWEPEFGGGGMSLSSTINFPVEPKKEGVGAGRAGAQGGSPKPQSQRNSLGWSGSLFILSTGSWARWAVRRERCVGPAEGVAPCSAAQGCFGRYLGEGEEQPPGTCAPSLFFVLKFRPPLLWAMQHYFPFPSHFCIFLLVILHVNHSQSHFSCQTSVLSGDET